MPLRTLASWFPLATKLAGQSEAVEAGRWLRSRSATADSDLPPRLSVCCGCRGKAEALNTIGSSPSHRFGYRCGPQLTACAEPLRAGCPIIELSRTSACRSTRTSAHRISALGERASDLPG